MFPKSWLNFLLVHIELFKLDKMTLRNIINNEKIGLAFTVEKGIDSYLKDLNMCAKEQLKYEWEGDQEKL